MRKIDYTLGHFAFNGQNSSNFGICVESTPSLDRPERQHNVYNVPGRNGAIIEQLDTFNNVNREYKVWAANDYYNSVDKDYNAISEWLYNSNGYCRLEDDFEPDIFRLAYFVGPFDVENMLNMYGRTKLTFVCRPERFYKTGEKTIEVADGDYILNKTAFTSRPLIKITGSGDCSIAIGNNIMYISSLQDYIYIDCDTMDAYRQSAENKNNTISGDFPNIAPGRQLIRLTGNITKVEIVPRWYTI